MCHFILTFTIIIAENVVAPKLSSIVPNNPLNKWAGEDEEDDVKVFCIYFMKMIIVGFYVKIIQHIAFFI